MKQAYIFIAAAFCLLTFLFSCSKEIDSTITTINIEDPEQGETYFLIGKVRDTTQTSIANATIRAVFGEFEMEEESDEDGNYMFKIPETEKMGFLIADKQDYYREVHRVRSSETDLNITLIRDSLDNGVSLDFDSTEYLSVKGIVIDQAGTAVSNAFCHVVGWGGNPFFKHLGVANSDLNGAFEVMIKKGDYQNIEIQVFTDLACVSRYVELVGYSEEDIDLGNVSIEFGKQSQNTTSIDVTQCSQNMLYSAINLNKIWYSTEGSYIDTTSNTLTLSSCDLKDDLIYLGAHTQDNSNFNGGFYNVSELPVNPSFDACTPAGNFLEIKLSNGEEYNFSDGLSFQKSSPDFIGISNDTYFGILSFSQHTDLPINSGKVVVHSYGVHLELQNKVSGEMVIESTSPTAPYILLDHNGTTNSGIIACNISSNGNTIPAKIRFRLSE